MFNVISRIIPLVLERGTRIFLGTLFYQNDCKNIAHGRACGGDIQRIIVCVHDTMVYHDLEAISARVKISHHSQCVYSDMYSVQWSVQWSVQHECSQSVSQLWPDHRMESTVGVRDRETF